MPLLLSMLQAALRDLIPKRNVKPEMIEQLPPLPYRGYIAEETALTKVAENVLCTGKSRGLSG
jgi:hypothetical protein